MARIYKRTDRVLVKVDTITIKLAPLTLDQKVEIQHAMVAGKDRVDIREASKGIALSIKYSVKGVEGLEDADGNAYQLVFDEDSNLTQECVDDLMNLELSNKLAMVCASLINGIPKSFDTEGVEMVNPPKVDNSKNA